MKQITITTFIILAFFISSAQNKKVEINANKAIQNKLDINPVKSSIQVQKLSGEANTNISKLNWNENLINLEKKHNVPNEIQSIIKEKTSLKLQDKVRHFDDEAISKGVTNPILGVNFKGNFFNGYIPPDNSMAISNDGIIISVVNTNIEYYDTYGSVLFSTSFNSFFNDTNLTSVGFFDPVVLYDAEKDRFIMVVLHVDFDLQESNVITCFSKTSNPNDGWWIYYLTGNPLNDNSFFDFPQIGISQNDFFVTGNLFDYSGNNNQSIIYQIEKNNAYNGDSLNWIYWANISATPFQIEPISSGVQQNYGSGIYLLSPYGQGDMGAHPRLFEITDDLSGTPELNIYSINFESFTNYLSIAGNALQNGTDIVLSSYNPRIDAIYLNGFIHLTFSAGDSEGYSGINYGRLNVGTLGLNLSAYGLSGFDYTYPSIALNDTTTGNESVMISFLRSGTTIYPEARVIACDNNNNWSNSTLIKSGEIYVDAWNDSITRWGDYTQICRKQNSNPPEFWLGTQYGKVVGSYNLFDTWIAQISDVVLNTEELKIEENKNVNVFPNPVIDVFSIEFSISEECKVIIDLFDINGRLVKNFYNEKAKSGRNLFSFNKGILNRGIYFLKINSGQENIKTEKIIIE